MEQKIHLGKMEQRNRQTKRTKKGGEDANATMLETILPSILAQLVAIM